MGQTLSDKDMLDWLEARPGRLEDVKWHMENFGGDIRSAIEELSEIQRNAEHTRERVTTKIKTIKDPE